MLWAPEKPTRMMGFFVHKGQKKEYKSPDSKQDCQLSWPVTL